MQEGDKTLKSVALVILIYPLFAYTQNFRFLYGTDGGKFALREGGRERGREGERERGREGERERERESYNLQLV